MHTKREIDTNRMEQGSELSTCRRITFYVIGSLLVGIVFFSVIELATRTVSWISGNGFEIRLDEMDPLDEKINKFYSFHPFTGFTITPRLSFTGSHPYSKDTAQHNVDQFGFISEDMDLSFEKPKDELRIAVIGASTSANVWLAVDENWPGILGNLIQKHYENKTIRVINGGVPGYNTAQSLGNLALRIMPFKPDVVIIYHAYNDFKAVTNDGYMPDYSHIHKLPYGYFKTPPFYVRWLNKSMFYVRTRNRYREYQMVVKGNAVTKELGGIAEIPQIAEDGFSQHISAMVNIAKGSGAKVVLSSFATLHDPDMDYNSTEVTESLSKLKKRELGSLVHYSKNLSLHAIMSGFNRYNVALKRIADKEHVGWVDNANAIPHEDKYFIDRVHFSAEGAELMAMNLYPVVINLLTSNPESTAATRTTPTM